MKLTTTRKITNNAGESVTVTFHVDFSNASDQQMAEWALSNRVIAGQKVWRALSADEIRQNINGKTFDARTIGRSIQSREKRIETIMNSMGVTRKVAEMIVDDPDTLNKKVEAAENE